MAPKMGLKPAREDLRRFEIMCLNNSVTPANSAVQSPEIGKRVLSGNSESTSGNVAGLHHLYSCPYTQPMLTSKSPKKQDKASL